MWPACKTTNDHVKEVTDAHLQMKWNMALCEYRLNVCDVRDNGSLSTQCDWRHEDVEKCQDYVLGKVRLQATDIIASVKNYYSRKKN